MSEQRRRLIIDCDPGHDDAIAIMMAARHPKLELLGITTARGNQTIEKITKNALDVCQVLDIHVPVCMGMTRPLMAEPRLVEARIHGETGLDGPKFAPLTRKVDARHAVDFIIESCLTSDQPITLCPTGPMTNIAMAIRKEPRILDKIEAIVFMGGSYQHGNVTPAAEFNIIADAEAAAIVFTCGRPVVMMGLDITRQVLCYPSIIERMAKIDNKASHLFCDLMTFFNKTQKAVFGWDGGPLHDPTTIAYLIDPSLITTKLMFAEVDITHGQSYGRTNCDIFGLSDAQKNVHVAMKIDVEGFWNTVETCIRLYS